MVLLTAPYTSTRTSTRTSTSASTSDKLRVDTLQVPLACGCPSGRGEGSALAIGRCSFVLDKGAAVAAPRGWGAPRELPSSVTCNS